MPEMNVGVSRVDCVLFARYPERVPFTDENVPPADKAALRDLRARLRDLVRRTAAEARTVVPLQSAVSSLNPNGRMPADLWACVYPASVPNKSYGLQVAIIVSARGVELCLCLGAGQSQIRGKLELAAAKAELARLKRALNATPAVVRDDLDARLVESFGRRRWHLRRSWRQAPGTADFQTLDEWLDHAAGPDGNGASISIDIERDEVDVRSSLIPAQMLQLAHASAPLLEWAYPAVDREPAARPAPAPRPTPRRRTRRPRSLRPLAASLYLDPDFLRGIVGALDKRGQVIFYGPPGTGKTHVARELVAHLAPDESCREIVQFHPSYSYEDFVMGFRPALKDGNLVYDLQEGALPRLARRAAANPGQQHLLLVDEINRGNLPRILGELLYLLDYRGHWISLMYRPDPAKADGVVFDGDGRFKLPRNLAIVATMNTADRSIGSIDAALRRRFRFVPFFPGEGALRGLLARWLQGTEQARSVQSLATWVDDLNAVLCRDLSRHQQVGHSYFMRKRLTIAEIERIWEADIMPFIEDQLFGHTPDELKKYTLARIRRGANAPAV